MVIFRVSIMALSIFLMACSNTQGLNKKKDYQLSLTHMRQGSFDIALKSYPKKEKDGFIQTTETSWIGLLAGESIDKEKLISLGNALPIKETVFLTEEASQFFYQKTPEGYFPAEHEVIFFHIVAAMSFLKLKDFESARVEAKRAAFYLQENFVSHQGSFDSAFLRVWLASIWTALGEWNAAQVDLRRASEISSSHRWAADIANLSSPPQQLAVVLQGVGPDLFWDPKGMQHLTGKGSLKFQKEPLNDLKLVRGKEIAPFKNISTDNSFYSRHQKRNSAIRELLETSDYMVKSSALHLGAGTAKGTAKFARGTLWLTGLVTGLSILAGTIYLAVASGSDEAGEIIGLGATLGLGAYEGLNKAGKSLDRSVVRSVNKSTKKALDLSESYRYVRFIPSAIGWKSLTNSKQKILLMYNEDAGKKSFLKTSNSQSSVEFFFSPL